MTCGRIVVLALAAASLTCGGGSSQPPSSISVTGSLTTATGLEPADYTVWGPSDAQPSAVAADGTWQAGSHLRRTGIIFATVKPGSAAEAKLGPESGIYMTPVAAEAHLVKGLGMAGGAASSDGAVASADGGRAVDGGAATGAYAVTTDGVAAMDATTTIIALLLMHPSLAHPAAEVSAAQLRWMTARLAGGWDCLSRAAAAYDADLVARIDFAADPAFKAAFATCLDDVAAIPVVTPTPPPAAKAKTARSGHLMAAGDDDEPVPVSLQNDGVVVSSVKRLSADTKAGVVEPATRNGTGLDYYYTVKQVNDDLTKLGTDSPIFDSPNQLEVHQTVSTVTAGFIPASSYWAYLDVIGNTFAKVTSLVTGVVATAPSTKTTLPATHMYEIRFMSGGFGFGTTAAQYDFATTQLSSEHNAALYQNVTMAVVEMVSLIPGADEVLAEGDSGKILQAVVQKTIVDLRALIGAKGANVTGDDIYNLAYGICQTAIESTLSAVTGDAQASLGKKYLSWAIKGGKKAIKAALDVPGKVAKGGALGNRAFRLANPESVLEYAILAVGYRLGNCVPMLNAMAIKYGPYPAECKDCANLGCASECEMCDEGSGCVASATTNNTVCIDACQVCNTTGTESKECSAGLQKCLLGGAFHPGEGEPTEAAFEANGCIVNACQACLDWYSAQAVCKMPTQ